MRLSIFERQSNIVTLPFSSFSKFSRETSVFKYLISFPAAATVVPEGGVPLKAGLPCFGFSPALCRKRF